MVLIRSMSIWYLLVTSMRVNPPSEVSRTLLFTLNIAQKLTLFVISGQLMYLTGMVDKRTLEKYEREAKEKGRESW